MTAELVFLARGGAENRRALDVAHDSFQPLIRLQREMLRVFIADRTEVAAELGEGNDRAA